MHRLIPRSKKKGSSMSFKQNNRLASIQKSPECATGILAAETFFTLHYRKVANGTEEMIRKETNR